VVLYDIVVPQDNLLRRINTLIDFSFVYQELVDKYCSVPSNQQSHFFVFL